MTFDDAALSDDAFLGGALRILQPKAGYRAATDPVFLAAAVPARPGETVLELGCGAGVAALCLARRVPVALSGLEIQPAYADLARRNARRNAIEMTVEEGDVTHPPPALRQQLFDHVMLNPPYFAAAGGTPARDRGRETANREAAPLAVWLESAVRRLKPGGVLSVIQRMERLPDLLRGLDARIGNLRVLPISAEISRPAKRFLLQGRKGAKGEFRLLPGFFTHAQAVEAGQKTGFSPEAEQILRSGAPLTRFS
ncbi:tRNA1(Val) (adenine(37)-N6)-methyltransferase [Brevirhabdus sp.]|uniref:tRNA1(Val) (adenine(37)-N6)-methyltransferase n=1 Tax=Brevirhabdus sp. TaxID=2004514 RepID=UPI004058ECFE